MSLGSALLLAGVLGNWRSSSAATHAGAYLRSPKTAYTASVQVLRTAFPHGTEDSRKLRARINHVRTNQS